MQETMLSVGIDIGTSTTQLVFSEIVVDNRASMASVPMITIVDKKVIYRSDIHFTPLLSDVEIDGLGVQNIIAEEYKKAGIKREDVNTGAVIITGEAARKENADEVLNRLSGFGGDFVVATAGPDLEGIIAGKGSGAAEFSNKNSTVVANLDIGGGTTNISVFKNGDVIDTSCLDIGGRLLKFDDDRNVIYLSEKMKILIEKYNLNIEIGKEIDLSELDKLLDVIVKALEQVVGIAEKSEELDLLVMNTDLRRDYKIEYVSFTGGVADCIREDNSRNWMDFNDMGIKLGEKIYNSKMTKNIKNLHPEETIRATVVGAGTHTTEISGSTINVDTDLLPLQNIPVLKLTSEEENEIESMGEKIIEKLEWFNLEEEKQLVALGLVGEKSGSFAYIQKLADQIIRGMDSIVKRGEPLIIIVENDMAKVLGQSLNIKLNREVDIICIDSIRVSDGDYVDIGEPLVLGKVVPVIVKTLLFNY